MDSGQVGGCQAPAQAIGDGKNLPLETNLLNIAGEKMEGSGTLGYPRIGLTLARQRQEG
jgi:hypothetical protein